VVPETTVERIAGFMWLYGLIALAGTLTVTALGSDPTTALGGVVSAMGNMGPALGEAGPTASFVDGYTRPARMALALLMLVGRLELFPMLLLLAAPARSVDRWRRAH
jgi:trk system potassium uptake protein TrkH